MMVGCEIHIESRFDFDQSLAAQFCQSQFKLRQGIHTRDGQNRQTGKSVYYIRFHWSFCQNKHRAYWAGQMRPSLSFAAVFFLGTGDPSEFALFHIVPTDLQPLNSPVAVTNGNQNAAFLMDKGPCTAVIPIKSGHTGEI